MKQTKTFPDPLWGWMDAETQDGWFARTLRREEIFRNLAKCSIIQEKLIHLLQTKGRHTFLGFSNILQMTIVQLLTFRDHPGQQIQWIPLIDTNSHFLLCSCGVDIFSPVISCMWGRDAMQWKHNLWHRRGNYPAVWNSEDIKRWHLFANNPNIVQVLKHRKKNTENQYTIDALG